jgi:crossover junction endodeoxyribonuclease RuvC
VRIFGIDPGSDRTGYGCVETDGRRHHLVACGAITALAGDGFPQRLARIHRELSRHLSACRPDCVAIENLFHAKHARSALKLGHARGVAMLAAVEAGCEIVEYTPAEVKRAVVGYGRAEKHQVQQMVKLLLGLDVAPTPHDAADALAVAICHMHRIPPVRVRLKPDTTIEQVRPNSDTTPEQVRLKPATTIEQVRPKPDTTSERLRRKGDLAPPTDGVSGLRGAKPKSWRQYRPPTAG